MLAQLIPADGSNPITLNRDLTVVGRSREICDLTLGRSSISKLHCLLVKTDGLLFVRDLGSTNGTKVNGQRIIRGALLPGDQLAFANIKFRVHLGPDVAPVEQEGDYRTEVITNLPPRNYDEPEESLGGDSSLSDVRLLDDDELE